MRILYFHQYFTTPRLGGGIRSYKFAQALLKRGHIVTIVCGGADDKFALPNISPNIKRGTVDGIDIIQIRVHTSNQDSLYKRATDFIKFGLIGIKVALKEEYEVLFATSTPLTAGIPGIFMKWFGKRKKFVFEVRDLWPELPKALGLKNPVLLVGMSILEKISYKKADACVGLSPGICDGIAKRVKSGKAIELIPNGCDLDIFDEGPTPDYIAEGINPGDVVAIFPGAHGVANGLEAVLDAAIILKQRGRSDIKVLFIGRGKVKEKLIKRAKDENLSNCVFIDPVSKFELNKIMARADIGLMVLKNVPAFYYGTSPNKFFDYIASGLPVVNNYPGWLADLISEHKCGVAVNPDSPKEFANALIHLADNPDLRREMGSNARKLAEDRFSRERLSQAFVDFIERIAVS